MNFLEWMVTAIDPASMESDIYICVAGLQFFRH